MGPEIERIKTLGFTALVECSTVGVGRRADIDRAVSEATDFPIVVPTGIYREPWVPPFAHEASEEALAEWMTRTRRGDRGKRRAGGMDQAQGRG
jgi:phosphotriesterase-related protein